MIDKSVKQLPQQSYISRLLQIPKLDGLVAPPRVQEKSSRVLTGTENLQRLRQKEQDKEEMAQLKAKKREIRELKKAAKKSQFTDEEVELYEQRYDNVYDLDHV